MRRPVATMVPISRVGVVMGVCVGADAGGDIRVDVGSDAAGLASVHPLSSSASAMTVQTVAALVTVVPVVVSVTVVPVANRCRRLVGATAPSEAAVTPLSP